MVTYNSVNFYKKSDRKAADEVHNTALQNITKKILENVNSKIDVIKNIEKYNDDLRLAKKPTIQYSVGFGETYINVVHSKIINANLIYMVGTDMIGESVGQKTLPNGNQRLSMKYSTHMVDPALISDINFGSYDPSKTPFLIFDVFEKELSSDDMTNASIFNDSIDKMISDLSALYSSGKYRSFFNKCSNFMRNSNINNKDYSHDSEGYDKYLRLWNIYLQFIKDINIDYDEWNEIVKNVIGNSEKMIELSLPRRFHYIQASNYDDMIDKIEKINDRNNEMYASTDKNQFGIPHHKYVFTEENTFSLDEMTNLITKLKD